MCMNINDISHKNDNLEYDILFGNEMRKNEEVAYRNNFFLLDY